jgi:hypothetical protein
MGTLTLEQSRLRMHICICLILCESCGLATLGLPDVSQLKNTLASPPRCLVCGEPHFMA